MANDPVRQSFELFTKTLGEHASKKLAELATKGRADIERQQQARHGVKPDSVAAVDGKIGAPFESVKLDGQIFIAFDYRREMIHVAFEELRSRSPLGPAAGGHYRDEHFCMLDGTGLDALQLPTAEQLRRARVITITNPMPYARKLEVQKGLAIYEGAMRVVRKEFGKIARIKFSWVTLSNAYTLKRDHIQAGHKSASRTKRAGAEIRYPAIVMETL